MTRYPILVRSLLLLMLLTQYAASVHAAEHHLFDDPLAAAQCDDDHLQQPFGHAAAASGSDIPIHNTRLPYIAIVCEPRPRFDHAYHCRAPPTASVN